MPDASSGTAPTLEQPASIVSGISDRVETRYKDAYRVVGFVCGIGTVIKVLAALSGLFIVIAGLIAGSSANTGPYGRYDTGASSIAGLGGLVMGATVFAIGFILGVIVSAHGQTLRASLDSAVHSSPFLDLAAKARAMGLEAGSSAALSEGGRKAIADLQKNWPGYS